MKMGVKGEKSGERLETIAKSKGTLSSSKTNVILP